MAAAGNKDLSCSSRTTEGHVSHKSVCLNARHRHRCPVCCVLLLLQVQALRSVEQYLGLEKLYVLGTNCVDNGPREGLEKFLQAASKMPETVLHYEVCCAHGGATRGCVAAVL